jgi:hypothetical protein
MGSVSMHRALKQDVSGSRHGCGGHARFGDTREQDAGKIRQHP